MMAVAVQVTEHNTKVDTRNVTSHGGTLPVAAETDELVYVYTWKGNM
jgi:hypothetical protein